MNDLSNRQWTPAFMKEYENPKGLNVVYSTAGHEVRIWYQRVGQEGLLKLIEALKSGEKFSAVYHCSMKQRLNIASASNTTLNLTCHLPRRRLAPLHYALENIYE